MSDRYPTEQNPPAGRGRSLRCEEWEALLADALDGTLAADDSQAFDTHGRECIACAQLLEEAKKGREWLSFLNDEPAIPADLLGKILERTSGAAAAGSLPVPVLVESGPAWYRTVIPATRRVIEPRMLMTAAMAFFSIAMTLNLTGIKLSDVRLADLRPSMLRSTLTRQYYAANEHVVKYYENLRFVYEVEAKVRELRRSSDIAPAESAPAEQKPQSSPGKNGSAGPANPSSRNPQQSQPTQPHATLQGDVIEAMCPRRENELMGGGLTVTGSVFTGVAGVFRGPRSRTEDQAERSLV